MRTVWLAVVPTAWCVVGWRICWRNHRYVTCGSSAEYYTNSAANEPSDARQETLPLTASHHSKTDEVSISSLDFPSSDTTTFYIGTEEGSIHTVGRYDQPSRKAGISNLPEDNYKAHAGPVTGLSFHPSIGNLDFGDLFLSSSVDWSVKLWRARGSKPTPAAAAAAAAAATANGPTAGHRSTRDGHSSHRERERDAQQQAQTPLHSFEAADDYVFDVKWHPHHPAIFGSVDGTGKFDIWNINKDVEVSRVE